MRCYTTWWKLMSENERQSQTNAVINDILQGTVLLLHVYGAVGFR